MDWSTRQSPAGGRTARLWETSYQGCQGAQVFETSDPDTIQHTLSRTYGKVQLSFASPESRLRIVRCSLGPVELHAVEADMRLVADAAPNQVHIVGEVAADLGGHLGDALLNLLLRE